MMKTMTGYLKTTVLLAGLTALFMGVGFLLGGAGGMTIALLVAVAVNALTWWNSGDMVLRMYDAHEVDERTAPEFHAMIVDLARRAGLPMPRVYLIVDNQPNAFATGRDPEHAAVAATTGLLDRLSREEAAGVMAHELAHIRNHDTLLMTVTATIAGAISMLANFALFFGGSSSNDERGGGNPLGFVGALLMSVLAPLAASLVQMAISRSREYEADRLGAEICGRPDWLADALVDIHRGVETIPSDRVAAHPEAAHLFIANPLAGARFDNLFSTHPAMENRVERLRAMTGRGGDRPARPSATSVRSPGPWG